MHGHHGIAHPTGQAWIYIHRTTGEVCNHHNYHAQYAECKDILVVCVNTSSGLPKSNVAPLMYFIQVVKL